MHLHLKLFNRETDLTQMLALAHAEPQANLHLVDLPYRLCSWALDDPENAALWTTREGEIRAWAVLQTPFWTIDLACHPDLNPQIYPDLLAWAVQRARAALDGPYGHPAWFVNVFPGPQARILALEAAGFTDQSHASIDPWSEVFLSRPAQPVPGPAPLPEGFKLRPLAGESEVAAYVDLHRTVFETKNMTAAWRKRTLSHPAYRLELDLVIQAPDGQLAAFCIAWYDPAGFDGHPCGQIEPLGVHPAFRRLGLGQAILGEALRRLVACGAQQLYVQTDSYRSAAFNLYTSAGFRLLKDVLVYRKNFGI